MPSFQWFKSLSKKNKKYHDYHGYDNLRHQPGAQFTSTPPMLGHQQQNHYHNGQLNHISSNHQHFTSQYNQPPPHSLSHRQHQQQLFLQSLPPPSAQQHLQQQQQQQQQHFQQQQQEFQPQQQQILQPVVNNQQQHIQSPMVNTSSLASLGPNMTHHHNPHNPPQHIVQHQNHPQHQHQAQCHQCNPLQQSSQMLPLQASTDNTQKLQQSPQQAQLVSQAHIPNVNGGQLPIITAQQHAPLQLQSTPSSMHHQPISQQHCQLQQTNLQCSNSYMNNQMNGYSTLQSQQVPISTPQSVTNPQCTCQSCPYQLQLQSQQQQHMHQQQVAPSQQQFVQQADQIHYTNGGCIRHHAPATDIQNNGNIDPMHNLSIQQLQHGSMTTTPSSNQMFPLHLTQQTSVPPIMNSSTPGHQHHQQTPTVHQQHHQQQLTQMQTNMQQCQQYHTMQPHMYQQQKQKMHHHRGHSQQSQAMGTQHDSPTQHHAIYQENLTPQSFSLQHHHQQQLHRQQQLREDEAKHQDYSRYANVQSLMNGASHVHKTNFDQASKYQDHVYCNQKPELPPYRYPPSYEQFIENRATYALERRGQHTTHLSESKLQGAKDSSYENLRPNRYQEASTS